MAIIQQAGMVTREFAEKFEWHSQDVGMAEEDVKVHLVSALNQDTLSYLDMYFTIRGGDKMAWLETIQDRLLYLPYIQMLAYLK